MQWLDFLPLAREFSASQDTTYAEVRGFSQSLELSYIRLYRVCFFLHFLNSPFVISSFDINI
jgi:hypothetical protein